MNCECCGQEIEENFSSFPSDEDRRDAQIIHNFKKQTDPQYAKYAEVAERIEELMIFGSSALALAPLGIRQFIRQAAEIGLEL